MVVGEEEGEDSGGKHAQKRDAEGGDGLGGGGFIALAGGSHDGDLLGTGSGLSVRACVTGGGGKGYGGA